MKRYWFDSQGGDEQPDGEWVRYEDAQYAIEKAKKTVTVVQHVGNSFWEDAATFGEGALFATLIITGFLLLMG